MKKSTIILNKQYEKRISVVTPCYNEEENIHDVYHAIKKIRETLPQYIWDHIFIDNSSNDKILEYLKEILVHLLLVL